MKHYDCIVVGFGTAGSMAAIHAAEFGASVLVLERGTTPGGTHTAGGVGSYYDKAPCGTLSEADQFNRSVPEKDFLPGLSERKKHNLEELAMKSGVEIHYQSVPTAALKTGGRVTGVRYLEAGMTHEASAHVLIDATAEGFFCCMAGCRVVSGRASDGAFQPFTNTMLRPYPGREVFATTFDAGRINPYNTEEYSETLLKTMSAHRKDDYGAEPFLLCPVELPGVRDGVHIVPPGGLYTLHEFFSRTPVTDPLLFTSSNLDTHARDIALESGLFQEWMIAASMWGFTLGFPVPLRTVFSVNVPGILVAGRCLGVDHDLASGIRMNGAMIRLGRAAGILAALAAEKNIPPENVPYSELKPHCILEPELMETTQSLYDLNESEVFRLLDSPAPGRGLWSAKWGNLPSDAELIRRMNAAPEGSELRRHSAFALAMRRNPAALHELREMVRERDRYTPETSRKYNYPRGCGAICLLGLMRDRHSCDLLAGVLEEENPGGNRHDSHMLAASALLKIGEAHPEMRGRVASILRLHAEDPEWKLEACLKGTTDMFMRDDIRLRRVIARTLESWGEAHSIRMFPEQTACAPAAASAMLSQKGKGKGKS